MAEVGDAVRSHAGLVAAFAASVLCQGSSRAQNTAHEEERALLLRRDPAPSGGGFRIKNGRKADTGEYTAVIRFYGDEKCTGTLISSRSLITARHCLRGRQKVTVQRRANSDAAVDGKCETSQILDLALCRLDSDVEGPFERINDDPAVPKVGAKVVLVGWGCAATREGVDLPYVLGEGDSDVVPSAGGQSSPVLTTKGGASTCLGDSGGPLFLRGKRARQRVLVGVSSSSAGADRSNYVRLTSTQAVTFLSSWRSSTGDMICGLDAGAVLCI